MGGVITVRGCTYYVIGLGMSKPLLENLPAVAGTYTFNRPLADLSWLKVGGPAEVLFQPADVADLQSFFKNLSSEIPVMPIGVCSNLIIRDGGIRGVVIRMGRGFNGIEILDGNRVRVGAAALDAHVARKAAAAGIDLAFLRTIPGAIGGAAKMNAGCYGTYTADVFIEAQAITRAGKLVTLTKADMDFAYRSTTIPNGMIIASVLLEGTSGDPQKIEAKMADAWKNAPLPNLSKNVLVGRPFETPLALAPLGAMTMCMI